MAAMLSIAAIEPKIDYAGVTPSFPMIRQWNTVALETVRSTDLRMTISPSSLNGSDVLPA